MIYEALWHLDLLLSQVFAFDEDLSQKSECQRVAPWLRFAEMSHLPRSIRFLIRPWSGPALFFVFRLVRAAHTFGKKAT